MNLNKISSYFDYLRTTDEEIEITEEGVTEALENVNITEYETVQDIPSRMVEKLLSEIIGGNKAKRMDPNQVQDILDLWEEYCPQGVVDLAVMAKLIRYVLRKDTSQKNCLLVVDVQNDFISGSLALRDAEAHQEAEEVVPVINDIIESHEFDLVVYTKDWHPEEHCSFITNVDKYELDEESPTSAEDSKVFDKVIYKTSAPFQQTLWPAHCVQDSEGAELHPDLTIVDEALIVTKGVDPILECYSVFWDVRKTVRTDLALDLLDRDITTVFLMGLAADFCVGYSSFDASNHGFVTHVVEDACRTISEEMLAEIKGKGKKLRVNYIDSSKIESLLVPQ